MKFIFYVLLFCLTFSFASGEQISVREVSIDGKIDVPQLYIVRKAIKDAIENSDNVLLLNINTPGGDLETTLKIMELIADFKGRTIAYVNPNAISAGSYIANSCDEVWFSPNGVMGAAAVVSSDGKDIEETMKLKINSFINAKVKSLMKDDASPYRADVQRAMSDDEFEFSIDGKILKKKGELLTLTAKEASEKYNGKTLLSNGTVKNTDELIKNSFGEKEKFSKIIQELSIWDYIAKFISEISPILMGIGIFLLVMEFKTAGFGVMGFLGIGMFAIVFLGARISGISGYEYILIFILGFVLVLLELIFLPGIFIPAITGVLLMLFAVIWGTAEKLPYQFFEISSRALYESISNLGIAIGIAILLILIFWKYFEKTAFGRKMILSGGLSNGSVGRIENSLIGKFGRAETPLIPTGHVSIDGKIYDATTFDSSHIQSGEDVEVVVCDAFQIKVKKR